MAFWACSDNESNPAKSEVPEPPASSEAIPTSSNVVIQEPDSKNINFDESYDIIASAEDSDEADFFRMATDLVFKQKQRKAVEENRF